MERLEITDALRCEIVTSIRVPRYQDCVSKQRGLHSCLQADSPKVSSFERFVWEWICKYVCACVGGCVCVLYGIVLSIVGIMETADPKNLRAPPKTVVNAQEKRIKKTKNHHSCNTPSKRKNHVVTAEEEYDAKVQVLQDECAKEEPKKSKLIAAMESTMAKRRQWIHDESQSVHVADNLEKFPPLTLGIKYVSSKLVFMMFTL